MTRFESEIKGLHGDFWKADAEKKVAQVRNDYESGKITVDENGIARNCIGRVLMEDLAKVLEYANCCEWFSREATTMARNEDNAKTIKAYKASREGKGFTEEEKNEMRAAFGEGTTVVDIFTGKSFKC